MSLHLIFFLKTISRVSPISIISLAFLTYSAIYLKTHIGLITGTFSMLIYTAYEKVYYVFTVTALCAVLSYSSATLIRYDLF
jgi:hypothetical protein